MSENCIFCKIVNGEIPSTKVGESEHVIVIETIEPVSEGHCLIIPKKHYQNVLDVPVILGNELLKVQKQEMLRLTKEGKADGVKMVQNNGPAAGQSVFHYHVHIIPEKEGKKRKKYV